MDVRERITGAVYGHLVGDALGVPYEFTYPEDLPAEITWRGYGSHDQPPGTWSDDGALMLCLLASLVMRGGFDPADAGARFVRWFDEGYMSAGGLTFDWGSATHRAVDNLRSGVSPLDAGPSGENDNGNGSLMRMLPMSLWTLRDDPTVLVSASHDCSRLTHGHPRSRACCALYGLMVPELVNGAGPSEAWDLSVIRLREIYRSEAYERLYADQLDAVLAFGPPSGTTYVVDCLRSAVEALSIGTDYESSVVAAVRYGHDTDTTAAVTGGLAGLLYGIGSIPEEWLGGLRLEEEERELIERFADILAP